MADTPILEAPQAAVESAPSFDMDRAVEKIGASLFPATEVPEKEAEETTETTEQPVAESITPAIEPTPIELVPPPKSWAATTHDSWAKLPKDMQDYVTLREKQMEEGVGKIKQTAQFGEALSQVISPYSQILQQQGLDAPRAVAALLQAHSVLTQGSLADRQAAYAQLGRNLGLAQAGTTEPAVPVDPQFQSLQQQVQSMQQTLATQQQALLHEDQRKVASEVETFANDPAHPYFDEVSTQMIELIQKGHPLQEAYEIAVNRTPATWAKEVARIETQAVAKAKENARLSALPKKQAASVNVKSRETGRAPIEPLGSIRDTLKSTLAEIRARA